MSEPEKCFCHFGGFAVKDATARTRIEEVAAALQEQQQGVDAALQEQQQGMDAALQEQQQGMDAALQQQKKETENQLQEQQQTMETALQDLQPADITDRIAVSYRVTSTDSGITMHDQSVQKCIYYPGLKMMFIAFYLTIEGQVNSGTLGIYELAGEGIPTPTSDPIPINHNRPGYVSTVDLSGKTITVAYGENTEIPEPGQSIVCNAWIPCE